MTTSFCSPKRGEVVTTKECYLWRLENSVRSSFAFKVLHKLHFTKGYKRRFVSGAFQNLQTLYGNWLGDRYG